MAPAPSRLAPLLLLLATGCSSGSDASGADSGGGDGTASNDGCDRCYDGSPGDAPGDSPAQDAAPDGPTSECVAKINEYRAKLSAPPVASKDDEVACALDQAKKGAADLADSGTTTFHKYFGQCSEKYQNECWYSVNDPSAVIDWCLAAFWAEGPPDGGLNHYSVMTDPKSTKVACALYAMPQGGYWMTNDFY